MKCMEVQKTGEKNEREEKDEYFPFALGASYIAGMKMLNETLFLSSLPLRYPSDLYVTEKNRKRAHNVTLLFCSFFPKMSVSRQNCQIFFFIFSVALSHPKEIR